MRAGKLDRRIRIERAETGENTLGEEALTWLPLAEVWAAVAPGPGRERFASAETAAEATTVFTIRWQRQLADLSPKDRIKYPVHHGDYFNIHAVVEVGRREGLQITATHRGDT